MQTRLLLQYTIYNAYSIPCLLQLEGGIHKYREQYPSGGLFQGKNYVFDQRIITDPSQYNTKSCPALDSNPGASTAHDGVYTTEVAGHCSYCNQPYDIVDWTKVCCVCRVDILICDTCTSSNPHPGEYHCPTHRHLSDCYYKNLTPFSLDQLRDQRDRLRGLEQGLKSRGPKEKNRRRTLRNQIQRIDAYIEKMGWSDNIAATNNTASCTS